MTSNVSPVMSSAIELSLDDDEMTISLPPSSLETLLSILGRGTSPLPPPEKSIFKKPVNTVTENVVPFELALDDDEGLS